MNDDRNMRICQIVGRKNAGKTTLMKQLISHFTENGLRVSTLKHHGHGGEPDTVTHTDSYRHMQAGSIMSAVQGEKQLHVTVNDTEKLTFAEILCLYRLLPLDLLLIEGYKNADYPKIVLLRGREDVELLGQLTNIIAVGCWNETDLQAGNYFTFSLQDVEAALPDLAELVKGD